MVFKNVCPRCKRRYPPNFTACLECGAVLVDTEKEAKKAELVKYLPVLGMILLCGVIIAAVLFFVLPLVQYSLTSGQEIGSLTKTAGQPATVLSYTMNQPANDGNLQVTAVKIRDGALSANNKKFFFVTVNLQNLRADQPVRIPSSDFTLVDSSGNVYRPYGLGDKVDQEIGPLNSESYELTFEIPKDAINLKLKYSFSGSNDRSAQTVFFSL